MKFDPGPLDIPTGGGSGRKNTVTLQVSVELAQALLVARDRGNEIIELKRRILNDISVISGRELLNAL